MSVDSLRPLVRQLARNAEEHGYAWMIANEPSVEDLLVDLQEIVLVYADTAALLAADWYNSLNENSSYSAVRDHGLDEEKLANVASWIHAGPQLPENRIRVAAHKLVFDAARRTTLTNAAMEDVAIARHESAKCCTKCIARATTAAKHRKSRSDDVNQEFHPSCEGMFIPVRTGLYEPPDHAGEWRLRIKAARRAGNVEPDDIASWLNAH